MRRLILPDNKLASLARKGYELLIKAGDLFQNLLLLLFRLNWGLQFFHNGIGKLQNHKDIVDFFTELGLPMPDFNAWMVGGTELIGGLLLVLGLATHRKNGAEHSCNITGKIPTVT